MISPDRKFTDANGVLNPGRYVPYEIAVSREMVRRATIRAIEVQIETGLLKKL